MLSSLNSYSGHAISLLCAITNPLRKSIYISLYSLHISFRGCCMYCSSPNQLLRRAAFMYICIYIHIYIYIYIFYVYIAQAPINSKSTPNKLYVFGHIWAAPFFQNIFLGQGLGSRAQPLHFFLDLGPGPLAQKHMFQKQVMRKYIQM